MIRTALTELLGIRYPVVQAAMGVRVRAAAGRGGRLTPAGLGLIASATMSLAELDAGDRGDGGADGRTRSGSICAPTRRMRPNGSG